MPELNVQVEWARFLLHLVNQIALAMERVEEMSEGWSDKLREQNSLLKQQNELLEMRVLNAEEARDAMAELRAIGENDAQKSR